MSRAQVPMLVAALLGLAALVALLGAGEEAAGPAGATGRAEAAESVDRGPEGPEAELVALDAAPAERVVAETAAPDAGSAGETEGVPPASLEGVLALPRGFPGGAAVRVRAWPEGDASKAPVLLDLEAGATSWRFEELPPGTWTISARAQLPGRSAWGRAEPLELGPGEARTGVRIALLEYVVTGVVTDVHGAPIAGLEVEYDWSPSDAQAGEAVENAVLRQDFEVDLAQGNFVINLGASDALLSGEMVSSGRPKGGTVQLDDPEITRALQGFAVEVREARAEQEVGDSVEVEELSSTAVLETSSIDFEEIIWNKPEARQGGWTLDGGAEGRVLTDRAGVFRIPVPGPGDVSVKAPSGDQDDFPVSYLPGREELALTAETPTGELLFALRQAVTLEGRLIRSDGSADRINVFLRRIGGGPTENATADGEGRYRFEGLETGEYLFYARAGGERGQDLCAFGRFRFDEGGAYGHDDVLTASSSVEGVLVDAAGEPLADRTVTAFGALNRSLTRQGRTGPDGRFRIAGMYPCDHVLESRGLELEGAVELDVPHHGALVDVGVVVGRPKATGGR